MMTLWSRSDLLISLKKSSTWQEPQSEPKLTDKSLVSIHPLPSNLRPSHNALKVISACAINNLCHFEFECEFDYLKKEVFLTRRNRCLPHDQQFSGADITSNKFPIYRGDQLIWFQTRNYQHFEFMNIITDLREPFIGKVGQLQVLINDWMRQDGIFWWFKADITLSLLYRNSDKKISKSSEKRRVFVKSLKNNNR